MATKKETSTVWGLVDAVLGVLSRIPYPHVLLWGPPGTGKTHAAVQVDSDSAGVMSVTLTEETPAAELRGFYVPRGMEFVWTDGPVVKAMRKGMRLALNELDKASGDVVSFLLSVLDDPSLASLTLPTGEVVRPAPGFTVVATQNAEPSELLNALRDRFPIVMHITEVHPGALASLCPDVQEAARGMALAEDERRISVRTWKAFGELRSLLDVDIATRACFGARGPEITDALAVSNASPDQRSE